MFEIPFATDLSSHYDIGQASNRDTMAYLPHERKQYSHCHLYFNNAGITRFVVMYKYVILKQV